MSRQIWYETLWWEDADGTAIANTTTETIVFPNKTIFANYLADHRALRIRASGKHSTTGTPTLIFRLRWGGVSGTVIGLSPTFTCGSGVSNALWELDALIQQRANGSSGTLLVIGRVHVFGATTPAQLFCVAGGSTPAATTCDLTADTALSLSAQWGAASASNTLTGMIYLGESMN